MADNKNDQNVQMKKMTNALKYTNGDAEKAKALLAGQYKDIKVLKGKLAAVDAELYSVFLIFYSVVDSMMKNVSLIIFTGKSVYDGFEASDLWRTFYAYLKKAANSSQVKESTDLKKHIINSSEGYDLFTYINDNDIISTQDILNDIAKKFFNMANIEISVGIEDVSSMEMEELGIKIKSIAGDSENSSEESSDKSEIEQEADHFVEGALVISPVRGKFVGDLKIDDLINIALVNKDPISLKVAAALNAVSDENVFLPIKGRIRKIQPLDKGFLIYCLIAKRVMAKIVEEENVKAEMYSVNVKRLTVEDMVPVQKNVYLFTGIAIGILLIIFIILYAIVI